MRREELLQRLVDGRRDVGEVQRDGTLGGADDGGASAGTPGEVLLEARHVAESRRHQHELGVGELEQRHLPGPATVGLGVEVELVHHHHPDVGRGALAQRLVGEHLRCRGDDGSSRVDDGVAGEHADVVRAERVAQREELLRHQRLDRSGVEAAPPLRHRCEVGTGGDEALARSGRRGEDHVRTVDDLDQRLGLGGVEDQVLPCRPGLEGVVEAVRSGVGGDAFGQAGSLGAGHRGSHRARVVTCGRLLSTGPGATAPIHSLQPCPVEVPTATTGWMHGISTQTPSSALRLGDRAVRRAGRAAQPQATQGAPATDARHLWAESTTRAAHVIPVAGGVLAPRRLAATRRRHPDARVVAGDPRGHSQTRSQEGQAPGTSRTTWRAFLSVRSPWKRGCRSCPSRVHSLNAIWATRSGTTQWVLRRHA